MKLHLIGSRFLQVTLSRCALILSAMSFAILGSNPASAEEKDYGKPGTPIKIVVGYQPYAALTWDGAVMRKKEYWRKYMPKGSDVEFQIGLAGALIVNQMLAGKQDVGYLGDMPAIVSTTKKATDISLVAVLDQDNLCNLVVVRADAPKFKDYKEAVQWLNGKQVAAPLGSCADRFARVVMKAENVKPAAYLNQSLELIATGFRVGKLDGAFQWEPTTAKLVEEGLGRVVASGQNYDELDHSFMAMRGDLIKQRPDVVKALLNAELDAQLFMADPANANELIDIVHEQINGFTKKSLWNALHGTYPGVTYKSDVRMNMPFIFTPEVRTAIEGSAKFLFSIKAIDTEVLRSDAINAKFAEEVLRERKLTSPVGVIRAQPISRLKE